MQWYAVYVKSRAEKKVNDRLDQQGFEAYCPLKTEVRQWSDRKKKVQVPYFSSYVFVKTTAKNRLEVLKTPGVVAFVYWLQQPAVISEKEMQSVQAFFNDYAAETIAITHYEPGQQLRVKHGVFEGKNGVVIRQQKNRVCLQLEQLNCSLSVELSKAQVEAV
ncbi:UpxY family transcription antiterminator [Mesonia aquimarina]|uniref:UpxY family transcription antiterminator n=1 Tax=Mesonia aquimarina TaxID=1504967 RepID=UPI000EF629EA|nr:UpxY family transcription antiterminator [Mesonia aquimarina]